MFGELKKLDEKEPVNVRMPKYIRDKAKALAKQESDDNKIHISESEIYRRIIVAFFSQNRL